MYVALFVAGLVAVVMLHEFGHYATAKAFGMKVERFFLGFGPTLWSFRRGETEYGVKAIPAGGFVKIVGMSAFERVAPADRGRTFHEQAAWKRAVVLVSGSATHFVVAVVLVFAGLALVGAPAVNTTIQRVVDGSPADAAGLRPGDEIVAVEGRPTGEFQAVRDVVEPRGGQEVTVTVRRRGEVLDLPVLLATRTPGGDEQGFLGVAPTPVTRRLPLGSALKATFVGDFSVVRLTTLTVESLGQVFSAEGLAALFGEVGQPGPRSPEGPMSLVGAGQIVGALGRQGDVFAVLAIVAQLNIVLGLLNLLPLPPLDGGHVAVLVTEEAVNTVRRRRGQPAWRVNPAVLMPLAFAVIMLFVVLG
ncbi:MAG: site-2 protease family protein, partial [Actinomycetota bacterium]|nr:site-2 protease family protein [Actinomycetota bacterium]